MGVWGSISDSHTRSRLAWLEAMSPQGQSTRYNRHKHRPAVKEPTKYRGDKNGTACQGGHIGHMWPSAAQQSTVSKEVIELVLVSSFKSHVKIRLHTRNPEVQKKSIPLGVLRL